MLFRRTGVMGSVEDSRAALARDLPQGFGRLREALKPLVGDMSHVVYVSYANPTLADGAPCPGGRAGFDIHPSFNADPQRLANVSDFVQSEFLPQLKALALCQAGILCRDPASDRMTFVDAHQPAFANHGFCARASNDPEFDRECFSAKGDSFDPDIVAAASQPMVCGRGASEYRAYLPRARWIRDANDSYFAAMTYPQGLPASSPARRHPRRDLGRSFGGLWRRGASDCRRPCRDGGRGIAGSRFGASHSTPQARSAELASWQQSIADRAGRASVEIVDAIAARWQRCGSFLRGGGLLRHGRRGGLIAAACAGRYFATTAGSSEAIAVSGSRDQVSSLPNSEIPR